MSATKIDLVAPHTAAIRGYTFLYPLIRMETTRVIQNARSRKASLGGNQNSTWDTSITGPLWADMDTLQSFAWIDIASTAVLLAIPDLENRKFWVTATDMWSNTAVVINWRCRGFSQLLFSHRSWKGVVPPHTYHAISNGSHIWIQCIIEIGTRETPRVAVLLQECFTLESWGNGRNCSICSTDCTNTANDTFQKIPSQKNLKCTEVLQAADLFEYCAEIMKTNPPSISDVDMVHELEQLGMRIGESFSTRDLPESIRNAMDDCISQGLAQINVGVLSMMKKSAGWSTLSCDNIDGSFDKYLHRAVMAFTNLGNPRRQDILTFTCSMDADGDYLDGSMQYVLHFTAECSPPVEAFWTVSLYDMYGNRVENCIHRHSIGSRHELEHKPDGSVSIWILHNSPRLGCSKRANWLPSSPAGKFVLILRLYSPKVPALDGTWMPPRVKKTKTKRTRDLMASNDFNLSLHSPYSAVIAPPPCVVPVPVPVPPAPSIATSAPIVLVDTAPAACSAYYSHTAPVPAPAPAPAAALDALAGQADSTMSVDSTPLLTTLAFVAAAAAPSPAVADTGDNISGLCTAPVASAAYLTQSCMDGLALLSSLSTPRSDSLDGYCNSSRSAVLSGIGISGAATAAAATAGATATGVGGGVVDGGVSTSGLNVDEIIRHVKSFRSHSLSDINVYIPSSSASSFEYFARVADGVGIRNATIPGPTCSSLSSTDA